MSLTGERMRVAVITGSTRGIGRAIANRLAEDKIAVVINGRSESRVEQVVREIRQAGGAAAGCAGDVSKPEQVDRLIQTAIDSFGGLDVLVNNAGIIRDGVFVKMSDEDWHDVLSVHLNGTFYCTKRAVNYMKDQGGGVIINMTSLAGLRGSFGQAGYAAAKAGVIALTWTLAEELSKYGIRVNAISPAALTDMTRPYVERASRVAAEKGEPIPDYWKIGSAEDVAKVISFLCSDDAKHLTGEVIGVNGEQVTLWSPPQTNSNRGLTPI